MGAAVQRLLASGAMPISEGGPQHLPANTGGVTAFKFRDPDGHPLELIAFPPGVGDPRWQRRPDARLTLGIDHFALVVSDVERSIAFYSAQLGFRVVSRTVNRGEEQNRLDGLAGVEVDVIALAPGSGAQTPHLELLGYRQPPFTGAPVLAPSPADGDIGLCCERSTSAARKRTIPMAIDWRSSAAGRYSATLEQCRLMTSADLQATIAHMGAAARAASSLTRDRRRWPCATLR